MRNPNQALSDGRVSPGEAPFCSPAVYRRESVSSLPSLLPQVFALLLLAPFPAVAQTLTYATHFPSSGATAGVAIGIPERDSLLSEARRARLKLGPVALIPELRLGNLGYTNNFYGTASDQSGDWTATISAGVSAYAPLGSSFVIKGIVSPSYTWYASNVERRSLGGTYSASLYAFLGRARLEVTGDAGADTRNLSSEIEQPVTQRSVLGGVRLEYPLASRTDLVCGFAFNRRSYDTSGLDPEDAAHLKELDGSDTTWRVGVRRKLGGKLEMGLNYENRRYLSDDFGASRDTRSEGLFLSAATVGARLSLAAYVGYTDVEPTPDGSFPGYTGFSGGGSVAYHLSRLLSVNAGIDRGLIPALYASNAFYLSTRYKGGLGFSIRSVSITGYIEVGTDDYLVPVPDASGVPVLRTDDVLTYRAVVGVPVWKYFTIGLNGSRTEYTSNVPGYTRTLSDLGFRLAVILQLPGTGQLTR